MGKKFEIPEEEIRWQAAQDGITEFVTSVAIARGDGLLVIRRAIGDSLGGLWELPGGGVDEGETFEEAAIRETREETGLVIGKILGMFEGTDYPTRRIPMVRQVNFVASATEGDIKLGEDHDAYRIILQHEIRNLPMTDEAEINMLRAFGAISLLKEVW